MRWLADRNAVDGTMVETVLQAAARRGDRGLYERLLAAMPRARDRRERRVAVRRARLVRRSRDRALARSR